MNPEESTEEQASTDEPAASSPPPRRNRWSRLLIVAGAVLSLAPLAKLMPHEHQIDFRIEDETSDVTRFDVDWTHLDGDVRGDVVSGSSRTFAAGRAPEIVSMSVQLPNGSYALDIRVEHADHVDVIQRRVTLGDANRIAIPLRADRLRP